MTENKNIPVNFLRGVPAKEAIEKIIPMAAEGYKSAISKYGADVLQYGHFGGFKPLREILGNIHNVDPDRVIVGNGGLEVISLFLKSLPQNSTVIVEEATYDRVALDIRQYGHEALGVEMTSEGVDLNDFKHLLSQCSGNTVFYGIPFHQNPSGINYSDENRKDVEKMCRQNNVTCAWDICYQDLRYDGKINTPFDVSDTGPVLFSSFTKTISPGTKCGYLVAPKEMISHITGVIANTRINPNLPTQAFISDFITSGNYNEFLNFLKELYKPRMDAFNKALKSHFPEIQADITGGFFAGIYFRKITPEKEGLFVKSAEAAGVNISSSKNVFAPNIQEKNIGKGFFIRLTFPALEPDMIEKGIATLKQVEIEI